MNYQQLQNEIKRQNDWADELAKQNPADQKEPADSQRRNHWRDDHPIND